MRTGPTTWARSEEGKNEDPDKPEVFERLYRDAYAPARHDYLDED